MFGLQFIKTEILDKEYGRFFSFLFDKRQTGDYDDFNDFEKEDVEMLLIPTFELIQAIAVLINS